MTTYRNANGSTMPEFTVAQHAKAWKRFLTSRKSAATRAAAVRVPTLRHDMPAEDYVALFDGLNSLKPLKYTWDEPQSHYGFIDEPVSVEVDDDERMAA